MNCNSTPWVTPPGAAFWPVCATDRCRSANWQGIFPISRPAISQHLRILKEARLVIDSAAGTRRVYAIDPEGFHSLRDYFDQFWTTALNEFKKRVEAGNK